MTIRAVAFDADGTLWDTRAAIGRGLSHIVEVLRERHPGVDVDERSLSDAWQKVLDDAVGDGSYGSLGERTLPELRRLSFVAALAERGIDDRHTVDLVTREYFEVRHRTNELFVDVVASIDALAGRYVLGLVTNGNTDHRGGPLRDAFAFRLAADDLGIRKPDARIFAMAAAAAGCHPNEVVSVGDDPINDIVCPQLIGCRAVLVDRRGDGPPAGVVPDAVVADLSELPAVLDRFAADDRAAAALVGVGPHAEPWPDDDRFDPALLAAGDRRNVVDRYRYWRHDAIVADLAARRHGFHVAVENWRHDRNIGAVVRNANAFGATAVHIVGRRRWNRRGAMATDRYLDVRHHDTVDAFLAWAVDEGLPVVAVDNVDGAVPIESASLPAQCILAFGQEGPGLSTELLGRAELTCGITQYGSTRSLNAGVASGIAMYAWARQHAGGRAPGG